MRFGWLGFLSSHWAYIPLPIILEGILSSFCFVQDQVQSTPDLHSIQWPLETELFTFCCAQPGNASAFLITRGGNRRHCFTLSGAIHFRFTTCEWKSHQHTGVLRFRHIVAMSYYFVVVGRKDNPIFELDFQSAAKNLQSDQPRVCDFVLCIYYLCSPSPKYTFRTINLRVVMR